MSAWDDVQTEDVKQIEAAVFRQMEGRSNSDPCSPWADLTLALCQRLSASEARAKELERERDEARAELASWGPTKNALRRENADLASRAATAEARREEAERARGLAEHFRDSATAVLSDALDQRDAAARGRDEARRALREVLRSHADCNDGTGAVCSSCAIALAVLSGAGAEEGRHTAASHPGEER
jgi:chromosome segregation ATPase